ncbi:MAG: winged helix DNA-binding domain-containing protein [Ignavibacteriae bacterium]|nr:winged helix DNA-binding domain-containing protein [Ignavibacteriota bacterium]
MKLSYSVEEVERWRDRVYRRSSKAGIRGEQETLRFINKVGFCLTFQSPDVELPNLWDAVMGRNGRARTSNERNYYLSYAWEIQSILPNHNSIYLGKIFKRRPSVISREYFTYFYALTARTGSVDEYKREFADGKLSPAAKKILDVLMRQSPMSSRELRTALQGKLRTAIPGFEKAIEELQRKMFITRIVGEEGKFTAMWAPIVKVFPQEVRKARTISSDAAREQLLRKYFENQLVTSIESIHKVFGWAKKDIYRTIGQLIHAGVIVPSKTADGSRGRDYCFVN